MARPTDIRVLEAETFFSREILRTPLKFGGVEVKDCLLCHVRVKVENREGHRADGWGAILLSDLWAWPSRVVDHATCEQQMRDLVLAWSSRVVEPQEFAHPVDLFWRLEPELVPESDRLCREKGLAELMPRMGAQVSASPVDAAIHDAFGNAAGIDTYDGYGQECMDHDLSRWLGPSFAGRYIADYLRPLRPRLDAFHLVGGLDKLTEGEITSEDPQDDLPVSLDQWIRYEGLRCLKLKLYGNDLAKDLERILGVVAVARQEHKRQGIDQLWLTADTNEMCETPDYMIELLSSLREKDSRAFDSLLYVEQPCERDLQRRMLDMRALAALKPVVVDEALASLEDLDLALQLGYSGAALKTCKCQSAELVIAAKLSEANLYLAVQDLSNPGISLLHSAGLAGRLNTIRGVESNSRQFFPKANLSEAKVHPGIYRLEKGQMNTQTIQGTGLGYRWDEIDRRLEVTAR